MLNSILNRLSAVVEAEAKHVAPYKTGKLMGSIHTEKVDDLQLRVFTNVEYAIIQEFGSPEKGIKPRAYMRAGAAKAKSVMPGAVRSLGRMDSIA
jgi:phage gpG-like protein